MLQWTEMKKSITIIINPASGKKDSILWSINNAFQKKDIAWNVQITHAKGDAYRFAKNAVEKKEHIVAVYGGDGTVAEVAKALYKTSSALFIIPGGTANIFAKEIKLPLDIEQSLALLTKKTYKIRTIDMGLFQKDPFVLRLELGVSASVVKHTKRSTKRLFGSLSYLFHLIPHLRKPPTHTFTLRIDNREISTSGIALLVANVGNIGIEGYSWAPHITVDDGLLDVVLFKEKTFESFLAWAKSTLQRKKPEGTVQQWKAKKIQVILDKEQTILYDDILVQTKTIEAEVVPHALKVIVP